MNYLLNLIDTTLQRGWMTVQNVQGILAEGISLVLSAPLVAIYAFAILIFLSNPPLPASLFAATCFFAAVLPLVVILCSKKLGVINDLYASDRTTRTKPFIGTIISYLLGVIALSLFQAPSNLVSLMVCYFVNSIIMMIVSRIWKISIHMSGIAGPATFLFYQLGTGMLPFFIFVFPVAWARVKLRAHSLPQVTAGALLTMGLTFIQLEFYSSIIIHS